MSTGGYSESFQRWKKFEHESKPTHEGTLGLVRAILAVVPKTESIIDLGAGTGRHVKMLREEGYHCLGVDSTPGVEGLSDGLVFEKDLTAWPGPACELPREFDWALFYDVGEHVPREHEQALIDNVCRIPRKGIIVSWGYPGESGKDHVNCRTQVHMACQFAKQGFWADDELTTLARDASGFWPKHHIRLFVATKR